MNPLKFISKNWRFTVYIACFSLATNSSMADEALSSISVFDWSIADALLPLELEVTALGSTSAFHVWTGNAYRNANIIDVGIQTFPNMELLNSMSPERILLSPRQTRLGQRLHDIAPITIIQSYPYVSDRRVSFWESLDAFTLEVGEAVNLRVEAEQLLMEAQSHLEILESRVPPQPPLLIVQLVNEHYVRIYGSNSMFQGVLKQLGLRNAWTEKTNQWGYSLVSIRELFNVEEARLVVLESAFPVGIENHIDTSGMWRYLPSVRRGDFIVLPSSFWIAGVHPSALRFAESLVEAL
ncbi:ABC transporter substrate-binding protein, partial [Halomonas sp. AOP43-D1-39]|uniref:ABC transporter substrate-binding protein n=1 Tax=Halomonas sp. AOP43-D1-39 TaxID=3457659 RepID=UPI004034688D